MLGISLKYHYNDWQIVLMICYVNSLTDQKYLNVKFLLCYFIIVDFRLWKAINNSLYPLSMHRWELPLMVKVPLASRTMTVGLKML